MVARDFMGSAESGARGVSASLPQAPLSCGGGGAPVWCKGNTFLEGVRLRKEVVQCTFLITAPPGDSLSADLRGAYCSHFHSIRADMSRRARCGIPQRLIPFQPCALGAKRLRWSPASAWDLHCFSQRAPCPLVNTCGLCQNNANARRLPTG